MGALAVHLPSWISEPARASNTGALSRSTGRARLPGARAGSHRAWKPARWIAAAVISTHWVAVVADTASLVVRLLDWA